MELYQLIAVPVAVFDRVWRNLLTYPKYTTKWRCPKCGALRRDVTHVPAWTGLYNNAPFHRPEHLYVTCLSCYWSAEYLPLDAAA